MNDQKEEQYYIMMLAEAIEDIEKSIDEEIERKAAELEITVDYYMAEFM